MSRPARITAVIGLVLLGIIGLFPPLKRPPGLLGGSVGALGSRAFLFAQEYAFNVDYGDKGQGGMRGAEIDVGRLFAETLVIVSAAGIATIVLLKFGARSG